MLPNHASLVVAEQFGMLEALHPGRIDLGIGRAPGTDPVTARALRRTDLAVHRGRVPRAAGRAARLLRRALPRRPPVPAHHRRARRSATDPPSGCSGRATTAPSVAGVLGLPFSFAHHFASANTDAAVAAYRASLPAVRGPGRALRDARRHVVVCADTTSRRAGWPGSSRLAFVRLRSRAARPAPRRRRRPPRTSTRRWRPRSPGRWTASHVVGSPDRVREQLLELADRTGADELMITTMVHGHADRLRSYELVAEVMELPAV